MRRKTEKRRISDSDRQWASALLEAISDQNSGLARAIRKGLLTPKG